MGKKKTRVYSAQFKFTVVLEALKAERAEAEITRGYWFHENISDWKPGSDWFHRQTNSEGTLDIVGKVHESDPPHRLVLSWAPPDAIEQRAGISRVSFDISAQDDWPFGPWAGLRVAHSELEPDSEMLRSITFGWPAVLSGLKTVIESPDVFGSD